MSDAFRDQNFVTTLLGTSSSDGFTPINVYVDPVTHRLLVDMSGDAGTVTSVAQTFTGGLISVSGSPITTSGTLALTVAGTSGGIPYFSSSSTWATSAALAANALVIGGGAGAAPATTTTGTGVVTALGVNVGTAGAFVVNGGALGTPSSGTVTNLTGTASININGTVGATTPAAGTFTTGTINTSLTMADAANIVLNTTTGTKIGTATTQKLGFFNSAPITQPTGSVITALQNLGLGASLTIPASTITSGAALTKTDDTNVTLTLGGSPTTALLAASSLTLGWTGTLAVARGGTGGGSASITLFNNITGYTASGATGTTSTNLVFSTSPSITTPTFVTNATVPLIIGGTGTTSTLTYKTTTGVGTTGADHIFVGGNNGGTELMRILNGGSVGVNTPSPSAIGTCFNVYGNTGSVSTLALEGDAAAKFLVAYSGSSSDNAAIYFKTSLRLGTATTKDATGLTVIATIDSTGLSLGTSLSLTTGTIELGAASDTTISRVSAGVIAVEGVTVATSSNTLTFSNKSVSGTLLLAEGASVGLDPSLSADGTWSGTTITGTSGYSQAFGDLVYLDPTDSRWEACDANAASGADGDSRGLVGMVVVTGTDGNSCTVLLNGVIRADTNFPTFTINNPIYISETAGDVTQTQPTTTDVVIRVIGAALTADSMYFNPDQTWISHT